jgi:hypothetical protein
VLPYVCKITVWYHLRVWQHARYGRGEEKPGLLGNAPFGLKVERDFINTVFFYFRILEVEMKKMLIWVLIELGLESSGWRKWWSAYFLLWTLHLWIFVDM